MGVNSQSNNFSAQQTFLTHWHWACHTNNLSSATNNLSSASTTTLHQAHRQLIKLLLGQDCVLHQWTMDSVWRWWPFVWDFVLSAQILTLKGHHTTTIRWILSGLNNIQVWNSVSRTSSLVHHHTFLCMTFSPNGRYVVGYHIGSCSKDIAGWNTMSGNQISSWTPSKHLQHVVFCPDGTQITLCCGERAVYLWEASSGAAVSQISSMQRSQVKSLLFLLDETQLSQLL